MAVIRKRSGWTVLIAGTCVALLACGSQVPPKDYVGAQGNLYGANSSGAVVNPTTGATESAGANGGGTPITGTTGTATNTGGGGGGGGTGGGGGGTTTTKTTSTGGGGGSSGGGKIGTGVQVQVASCAGFKNTTGISNSTINLANVADVSGPVSGLFAGAQQAMKAFVAYFNSTSSICGRKLSATYLDSQTSETGDQQATTTACGSAFAMVGSMGAFDGGGTSEVTHCGIPDLRAAVTESVRLTSPDVFATQSLNANYEPEAPPDYYLSAFGKDVAQHAAFVYLDAGASSYNAKQEMKSWTARGFKFVYSAGIPVTEFNYATYVSAMQSKSVKYVQYVGAYQEAVTLAKAMAQQNFKAKLVFDPEVYDPGFISSGGSAVNGAHVWINSAIFEEASSNPEMQLYEKWLSITSPGKSPNYFGLYAWAAGELFVQEALKLGGKLTRASLIASLKTVNNYTGNGLFGPQHVGQKLTGGCYGFITLVNGKWTREGPKPFSCQGLVHVGS
ncbi:ABC transporter substrate-binding protein [Jatrophihabitans sp.]|uniref:ABC transporter substrate-binding protein n=1 Tax=Jatrophihabitans sp. TaxID=1932789 RepID=UPI0030C7824D|nr:hypothetical protein [Jatrophihabitans sp.]